MNQRRRQPERTISSSVVVSSGSNICEFQSTTHLRTSERPLRRLSRAPVVSAVRAAQRHAAAIKPIQVCDIAAAAHDKHAKWRRRLQHDTAAALFTNGRRAERRQNEGGQRRRGKRKPTRARLPTRPFEQRKQ